MKKFWSKRAILLCLLATVGFAFIACSDDSGDSSVAVTGVSLDNTELNLIVGRTATLTATVAPENATNKKVTWLSSDSEVADVEDGTVTAKAAGTATITVTTDDGSFSASAEVTVNDKGIELDTTEVSGVAANTKEITPTLIGLEGETVSWTTSADTVATVANGVITLVGPGEATITATVEKDGKTYTATVSVFVAPKPKIGSTEYNSIQAAVNTISATSTETTIISLPKGEYRELVYYKGSATIVFKGEGEAKRGTDVVIAYSNSGNSNKMQTERNVSGGYLRSVVRFEGSANIVLENLTIQNTYKRADGGGSNTQAEALLFYSTGHLAAYNCSFLSHQDTIQTEGKAWFYDCYVEGDVDFTWIEHNANGTVALYENCTLKGLGEEVGSSAIRFAAPRLVGTTTNIGKGEVFLNSTFDSDGLGDKIYLARSVASGTDVDQVAFINSKATDALKAKLTEPWEKTPFMLTGVPRTIIGWKMDSASATAFGYTSTLTGDNKDILDANDVTTEFGGRAAILNRVYNKTVAKYRKDFKSYWDVATLVTDRSWEVSTDTSSALLTEESDVEPVYYTADKEISEYSGLTTGSTNGFAKETGKNHWVGQKDATLTIPVTGKALITVVGYYKGNGTIGFSGQGDALYAFNNNNTNSTLEKTYMNYTGSRNVVITATGATYITEIAVEYDNTLTFDPVTKIDISATGNATSVVGKKTLQLSAALTPSAPTNSDVVWSVDDEDVAIIDQTGLLTAKNVKEEKTVVVTCTSKDANGVSGTYSLTVEVAAATSFDIQWLDTEAHCAVATLDATNGNEDIAAGGHGTASDVSSKWPAGWKTDIARKTAGFGCIVVTTSDTAPVPAGYDTFYVDFPITAKVACAITSVTLGGANWGTGNVKSQISYKRANDSAYTVVATDLVTRQITSVLETPAFITLAANETITLRIAAGAAAEQAGGRYPGVPTVIVNGEIPPEAGKLYSYSLTSYYDADNLVSESLSSDSVKNLVSADGFFTLQAYSFNGTQHGVVMKDSTFTVKVLPGAVVSMYACQYNGAGEVTVTSDVDETLSEKVTIATGTENEIYSYTYNGSVMATLTFTFPNATNYLHKVTVQD